ncbi:hypothetical protein [Yersinia phage fHe-Yen9-04]|uniref:Uncharacterized protein n=2 Tax=Eneladusvirus Yen904 TaxID=2560849 RepID=A0A2C9CY09_9CAUD|nr:hypothetical protein FDJ41_gp514 [Yersinia phage fHe-Yen9-04]SOK58666.1 hypothetical protein [Yersinia phage fHe-Yen9-04]SOK59201.1 hypothetical protein [Yersinia phage fHe-Yen9-03]VUE36435.1 hypothetical protein [Yersinia phage fHe-Yen9-04]
MITRYELIDGEIVPHEFGEYVKFTDYKQAEDARSKAVSDAGWAADAAREQNEINRYKDWN